MFQFEALPSKAALAGIPPELPFRILLVLPEDVSRDPAAPIFNLPRTISALLGRFGWGRANKILAARVWADGWSDVEFERYASSPFLDIPSIFTGRASGQLRALASPFTTQAPAVPAQKVDILHLASRVEWHDGERAVNVGRERWLDAPALLAVLRPFATRLLILQVPLRCSDLAVELGRALVQGGIPAVLVAAAREAWGSAPYLETVYANLVHNEPFPALAKPEPWVDQSPAELVVHLLYGSGCEQVLQLERYLATLTQRFQRVAAASSGVSAAGIANLRAGLPARALHVAQRKWLDGELARAERDLPQLLQEAQAAAQVSLSYMHESQGAEPLSRLAETANDLEARASSVDEASLARAVSEAEERAPRVLNANFSDVTERRVLGAREPLLYGREYDLLVDIGPAWDKVDSIVSGKGGFPEKALRPGADGYAIDVVFATDDLTPALVTGRLWLPRDSGRSRPWREETLSTESGPIALRLRAPTATADDAPPRRIHGRLFLYHENNLLQSAAVSASVARKRLYEAPEPNRVDVDFVLTATFQELTQRLATRELRLAPGDEARQCRLALNITLNQDGKGTHRVLVSGAPGEPPAWMAYDPAAARRSLERARAELLNCHWARDAAGKPLVGKDGKPVGLDAACGKPLVQLRVDIAKLARVGSTLYGQMLQGLRTGTPGGAKAWDQQMRARLRTTQVVQIARIEQAPTQYAYPWALLYDVPLEGTPDQIKWCEVLWEWSDPGIRTALVRSACPFADEPWHRKDVLCPYGFWGLKHVIEQPLAPASGMKDLLEATKELRVDGDICLSVGWTRDASLDLAGIERHVNGRLCGLDGVRLSQPPPNPADDRDGVSSALSDCNLAYFICHCERGADDEPFLNVGPHDDLEHHRIYVNTVQNWARTTLVRWDVRRPLVFINGCHTADLTPGEVLNFVSAFAFAGASAVIGTDVAVQLPVALKMAEGVLQRLVHGERLGEAIRAERWALANRGNLLGLCYTPYGLSDFQLVRG